MDEQNEREHVVSSTLFDSLANIMTVITLRLEKSMESGLLNKIQLILPPFKKRVSINEWKWFVADMMVTLIYVVIAAGFVWQNWETGKVFPVAGLVTLLGFVNQFTTVFHDVAWQYTEIIQHNTHVETARNIEKAFEEQHRPDELTDLPDNWQTIEIKDLSFSHRKEYDSEHAPQSLHKLNLTIGKGKRIALIGESGSGKSTLLALLRGLYNPEEGMQLLVDGKPYALATINETVTLFPQEPEIFENTIAYNITLGASFYR